MDSPAPDYDPRYLAGIRFFNERDFFEAHEAWESLWLECAGPERRFYQGLIQAAVALYHFGNGNLRGAVKLYHSCRNYLAAYGPYYLGLDLAAFDGRMTECFADILADPDPNRRRTPLEEHIPVITLDPPPTEWPDPAGFEREEEGTGR